MEGVPYVGVRPNARSSMSFSSSEGSSSFSYMASSWEHRASTGSKA